MYRNCLFYLIFFSAIVLFLSAGTAAAQCPDIPEKSSCITCHQTQTIPPDRASYEWHNLHFQKDCCTRCHGGNCIAEEEDLAHEGMAIQPLEDIFTSCHGCHPDDYQERANLLAASIGVVPGSRPTPTPVPTGLPAGSAIFVAPPAAPVQTGVPASVPLILGGSLLIWFLLIAWLAKRLHNMNSAPVKD